jgi:hypothetical protein
MIGAILSKYLQHTDGINETFVDETFQVVPSHALQVIAEVERADEDVVDFDLSNISAINDSLEIENENLKMEVACLRSELAATQHKFAELKMKNDICQRTLQRQLQERLNLINKNKQSQRVIDQFSSK